MLLRPAKAAPAPRELGTEDHQKSGCCKGLEYPIIWYICKGLEYLRTIQKIEYPLIWYTVIWGSSSWESLRTNQYIGMTEGFEHCFMAVYSYTILCIDINGFSVQPVHWCIKTIWYCIFSNIVLYSYLYTKHCFSPSSTLCWGVSYYKSSKTWRSELRSRWHCA